MRATIDEKCTILRALYYAAQWELSILATLEHMKDDPMFAEAAARCKDYTELRRKLHKRWKIADRFGE
jgi:hypothetical protein